MPRKNRNESHRLLSRRNARNQSRVYDYALKVNCIRRRRLLSGLVVYYLFVSINVLHCANISSCGLAGEALNIQQPLTAAGAGDKKPSKRKRIWVLSKALLCFWRVHIYIKLLSFSWKDKEAAILP